MTVRFRLVIVGFAIAAALGCRLPTKQLADVEAEPVTIASATTEPVVDDPAIIQTAALQQVPSLSPANLSSENPEKQLPPATTDEQTELPAPEIEQPTPLPEVVSPPVQTELSLAEVVESVRSNFPLIIQAAAARRIASGEALSASGAFDHKLKAYHESQPLDFYENYHGKAEVSRETIWGGRTFASYRIGRGFYEPWYLERETNDGGEFKAGFVAPIIRDRWIDANRAKLWQAQLESQRVEPEIMAAIIRYVREGSVAYWKWIAAGANKSIAEDLLALAQVRNEALAAQIEAQEKAEIDMVDNRRIIVSREAKLIDAQRKLEQATIKLSLYYRSVAGDPILMDLLLLPEDYFTNTLFDEDPEQFQLQEDDTALALALRPELTELQVVRRQLSIALRQAKNETNPDVDAGVLFGQDVGAPTSADDKGEFEVEARITVEVPIERRKAFGKIRSLRGKLAQLTAKNRFTSNKIVGDVLIARAALKAARQRVERARENYDLATQMQEAEQQLFDLGQSTLFNLNIREKQAAEAAVGRIEAQLEFQIAVVDYTAALGITADP